MSKVNCQCLREVLCLCVLQLDTVILYAAGICGKNSIPCSVKAIQPTGQLGPEREIERIPSSENLIRDDKNPKQQL